VELFGARIPGFMITVETFPNGKMLQGMCLDRPANGEVLSNSCLELRGWVITAEVPAVAVEVRHRNEVLWRIPVTYRTRPALGIGFPRIQQARLCGFAAQLSVATLGASGDIKLSVRLENGGTIPFARLTVKESLRLSSGAKVTIEAIISSGGDPITATYFESPRCGAIGGYALNIGGWALGSSEAIEEIELVLGQSALAKLPCRLSRPDIASAHSQLPWAAHCGFSGSIGALELPRNFNVHATAVFADGRKIKIAEIIGRREAVRASTGRFKPLLISTLGRSGSTWVISVLGQHPQLLTYGPFQCEPRLTSYWLGTVASLADPQSICQALGGELAVGAWWNGQNRASFARLDHLAPELEQWLTRDQVDELLCFAQQRIEAFYAEAAIVQGQTRAEYFIEKCWPGGAIPGLAREHFPSAREIILVRDFRDVIASILAFNKKQGHHSFGRELAGSDLEFVEQYKVHAGIMQRAWEERRKTALLVKYEDFLQKPTETLTGICSYLGIDREASTVETCFHGARQVSPEAQRWHITSGRVEASIRRWQTDLSPDFQRACKEHLGEALATFGYDPS
jgi:Sulfotransferase family